MYNTFSIDNMTVEEKRTFMITQNSQINLFYSKKHHNQNPEKKNFGCLPTENVKMRILKLFLLLVPLLYPHKRSMY